MKPKLSAIAILHRKLRADWKREFVRIQRKLRERIRKKCRMQKV